MSHTSTDTPTGSDNTDAGGEAAPFRRALTITVVALVILVAGFAGLNYLQGPKLSSGSVDAERVVAQAGQQLRLFANQSIRDVARKHVSVSPAVPFTVSTTGAVIAVQFSDRLRYSTTYSVRVSDVANAFQPRVSTFDYSFTTAPAEVYYLDRADPAAGGGQDDSIIRTGLTGSERTVVYSAPRIQQFVVFAQAIAVTTLADDGTSALSLVGISSKLVEQIQLPGQGAVDELQGESAAGLLGFVFTSAGPAVARQFDSVLMRVDLTGAHTVAPVPDLAGNPLAVLDWGFLGGSTSIVAQGSDQTVLLIDATKTGPPVPLGQYTSLGRSSPDGRTIVVSDVFGTIAYSLADGKETRIPSLPIAGASTYGGDVVLLGKGTDRVQQVAVFDSATGGKFQSYLIYESGTTARVLYQTKDDAGSIEGFSISPNGQFVAVNVIPDYASSVSDGYPVDAQSTSISTVFIDIASGAVVRSVEGFDESW
ncbi:WD40 repeat domain-containing protein [Lacisediminihabitans sp. FW035]